MVERINFIKGWSVFAVIYLLGASPAFGSEESVREKNLSIQALKIDENGDGVYDIMGDTITVSGIANVSTGNLHEIYLQIFIQNQMAGISLFDTAFSDPIRPGDSVVATGVLQKYFGLVELLVHDYEVYPRTDSSPPDPIPLNQIFDEFSAYEGMAVEGEGIVTGKGTRYNGKYLTITPDDKSGRSIWVFVSNFHRFYREFDFESLSKGDRIQVAGILSYFDPGPKNSDLHKIFLRTPDDLKPIGLTHQTQLYLISIGLLIGIVAVGWIVMLRTQVKHKTREIKQSLEDNKILVKEVHHRVKNNLSVISGLIELQMTEDLSEDAQRVLRDSQSRIHSMALIHDKLYRTSNASEINMQHYIPELVDTLRKTFSVSTSDIDLQLEVEPVVMDADRAIVCGLLINELVVNSFKHAFNGYGGVLTVVLNREEDTFRLVVADNGKGIPPGKEKNEEHTLGLMLVESFRAQLKAKMTLDRSQGTRFTFRFPVSRPV